MAVTPGEGFVVVVDTFPRLRGDEGITEPDMQWHRSLDVIAQILKRHRNRPNNHTVRDESEEKPRRSLIQSVQVRRVRWGCIDVNDIDGAPPAPPLANLSRPVGSDVSPWTEPLTFVVALNVVLPNGKRRIEQRAFRSQKNAFRFAQQIGSRGTLRTDYWDDDRSVTNVRVYRVTSEVIADFSRSSRLQPKLTRSNNDPRHFSRSGRLGERGLS